MGVESFGLVMRAYRRTATATIGDEIRAYPCMRHLRSDSLGSAYEYLDERHLFEVLLRSSDADVEFDLSVRFALCNPDSIDLPFSAFLRWAVARWQPSSIWLLSSKFRKAPLALPDFDAFLSTSLRAEIHASREYWQAHFGVKRGAVRVEAAWVFAGVVNAEIG